LRQHKFVKRGAKSDKKKERMGYGEKKKGDGADFRGKERDEFSSRRGHRLAGDRRKVKAGRKEGQNYKGVWQ